MKNFLIVIVLLILISGVVYFYVNKKTALVPAPVTESAPVAKTESKETQLAPEVEVVLASETEKLKILVANLVVVSEVRASNEKNKNLTQAEIQTLDKEWQASKNINPFIQKFLDNKTAEELRAFQNQNPSFKEIFVADAYGLNVGQTNKTSDYYQADESWWVDSFNGGVGKITHGKIEFDQSSQTEAISIYLPIMDTASGKAIGVFKGVLDLKAIKNKL